MSSPLLLLTPSSLTELLSGMPAETRAQLAWLPRRIAAESERLLTAPILTDESVDRAADAYLDVMGALAPAIEKLVSHSTDVTRLMGDALRRDLPSLAKLPARAGRAATRALTSFSLFGSVSVDAIRGLGPGDIGKVLEHSRAARDKGSLAVARSLALILAVLEGARSGTHVPGRLSALCRFADREAFRFVSDLAASNPGFRVPWYFKPPEGAESFEHIASWAEPDLASDLPRPLDEERWSKVAADIDASRPHRKLFS